MVAPMAAPAVNHTRLMPLSLAITPFYAERAISAMTIQMLRK